jgi:hypothetical protein
MIIGIFLKRSIDYAPRKYHREKGVKNMHFDTYWNTNGMTFGDMKKITDQGLTDEQLNDAICLRDHNNDITLNHEGITNLIEDCPPKAFDLLLQIVLTELQNRNMMSNKSADMLTEMMRRKIRGALPSGYF